MILFLDLYNYQFCHNEQLIFSKKKYGYKDETIIYQYQDFNKVFLKEFRYFI